MSAQRWVARSNREVWTSDGGTSETRVAVVEGDITMERAHLIAAAPELLAALRSLQAFAAACDVRLTEVGRGLSRDFEHGDVITFARAAIAKAGGRS